MAQWSLLVAGNLSMEEGMLEGRLKEMKVRSGLLGEEGRNTCWGDTHLSSRRGYWTTSLSQQSHCPRTKEFNFTGTVAFKVHFNGLLES